jgi:hypothetical protein
VQQPIVEVADEALHLRRAQHLRRADRLGDLLGRRAQLRPKVAGVPVDAPHPHF